MTRSSLGVRDLSLALAASVAVHGLGIAGFFLFDPDVKAPDYNVPVEIVVTASSGSQAEATETTERADLSPARGATAPKPTRSAAAPPSAARQEPAAVKPPARASDDAITITRETAPQPAPASQATPGSAGVAAATGAPAADAGAGHASAPSTPSGQVAAAGGAASSLGDGPPRYRLGAASTPAPGYPYQARKRGAEGRVVLRLEVGADGRVTAVSIHESSGHDVLDRAAVEALSRWRLDPAVAGGRPAAAQILVPVRFRLDG
jgi:periplasmic protein TonB